MTDIDKIMHMLDWNNPDDIQEKGIFLAKSIECFNVFLQPNFSDLNKNVWYNCAVTIYSKTDDELTPYLFELFRWLQDMNWPGAQLILERLKQYSYNEIINNTYNQCVSYAKQIGDTVWEQNLIDLCL